MTDPQLEAVEPSAELALVEQNPPATLFGTSDPTLALARMSEIAKSLVDVVRGAAAVHAHRWKAPTSTARRGLASAGCRRARNRHRDPSERDRRRLHRARRSLRTIRASLSAAPTASAHRRKQMARQRPVCAAQHGEHPRNLPCAARPAGQIVVLAGYAPAAAEEIVERPRTPASKLPPETQPTGEQISELRELFERLTDLDASVDWVNRCREIAGVHGHMLTRGGAGALIDKLRATADELKQG